jgi:5-methyltetrahydrofolate--homocysteine methyltransferase
MKTVLSSAKKTVVISPDDSFVVIGERINPTNRKKLAEELRRFDYTRVKADALAQVQAGAQVVDVNCGVPGADEPAILKGAVEVLQATIEAPLSLDSSVVEALEAALPVYKGKALINSVTGDDRLLDRLLPVVKRYNAAVIGITHDESGIKNDAKARLAVAEKIVKRALEHGIPKEDVVIDPICMPIGANTKLGTITLDTIRLVKQELGVNISIGAGNVGFGLPDRPAQTAAIILLGMPLGLTASIANPLEHEIYRAVLAGDLMLGRDSFGMKWMGYYRKREAEAKAAAAQAAGAVAEPPKPVA